MIAAFRRALRRTTPAEIAARELGEAELSILHALSARDYAESVIAYDSARIKRLRSFLAALEPKI